MITGVFLPAIILAAEGGSIIDIDPGVVFWTIVTFIMLLLILKKYAWKPILTALDQRENAIRESLEKAEKAKEEAQNVLAQNQANLAKAEEESKKIVELSRQYAEKLKDQILHDSRDQAKKMLDEASNEIERKKDAAIDELKTQVAEIAIKAAEKILKESLNEEMQKRIINKYIGEITNN